MLDVPYLNRIFGEAIVSLHRPQLWRFLSLLKAVPRQQEKVLLKHLSHASTSRLAARLGFSGCRTVEDFRRRVPITTYETMRTDFDAVCNGDYTALLGQDSPPIMFALTSGTTAAPKFIPVTKHSLQAFRHGWALWGVSAYSAHPGLYYGSILNLTGSRHQQTTAAGIPVGSMTGLLASDQPYLVRQRYIVDPVLNSIADYELRYYTILRLAMARRDVRFIATANPSTLALFAKYGVQWAPDLIRDIHDGTTRRIESQKNPRLAALLSSRRLRANPARARILEKLLNQHGELLPKHYWPDLALLSVWLGGTVQPYLDQLTYYYGDVPRRDPGLFASEGRMTIPLQDDSSVGVLDVASHFFEFIPEDAIATTNPTTLLAHELEVGCRYFILLTTGAGLYRYNIFDLVECVGFLAQAPLLKFLGKGTQFSSITGEKLSAYQIAEAARKLQSTFPSELVDFSLMPRAGDPPRYILAVETGTVSTKNTMDALAQAFDRELRVINIEYNDKRASNRLGPLMVQELPRGTWQKLRLQRVQHAQASMEQYKQPLLVGDVNFWDYLSAL